MRRRLASSRIRPWVHTASAGASATRVSAPAASSTATGSTQFAVCGPIATAQPRRAGSSGLCPPIGTRLPPTKAWPTRLYSRPSSPIVSASHTPSVSGGSSPAARRVTVSARAMPAISAPRSGWRGAMMVSRPGWRSRSAAWTASATVSSPRCVLAASQTGRPPMRARSRSSSATGTGSGAAANFRFSATLT